MEHTKVESAVLEIAIAEAADAQVRELKDLQFALVGGGVGEITPY